MLPTMSNAAASYIATGKVLVLFFSAASRVVFAPDSGEELRWCRNVDKLARPAAVNPSDSHHPWVGDIKQELLSALTLPTAVRKNIDAVVRASNRSSKSAEYGSLMVESGGRVVASVDENGGQLITSEDPRAIAGAQWAKAADLIVQELRYSPLGKAAPITLYQVHSHPDREGATGSFSRPPIYHTNSGVPYTHTNRDDIESANQMLSRMTEELRAQGYTGPIQIVSIVTPAKVGDGERFVTVYSK
jgi:hypothetical protein